MIYAWHASGTSDVSSACACGKAGSREAWQSVAVTHKLTNESKHRAICVLIECATEADLASRGKRLQMQEYSLSSRFISGMVP